MDIDALTETLVSSAWEYDGNEEYWFPASHSQRALWFICDSNPDQFAYNIPIAYRIGGSFDPAAMARAIETVLIRHDAFRTTFVEKDGEIHQVVRDGRSFTTPIVSVEDADDPNQAIETLLGAWLTIQFDLKDGPLVKAAIIRVSEAEHYLLIAMHHTIIDHLSIMKMGDEFAAVYQADLKGAQAQLAELELQYPDYAVWQDEEKTPESVADRLDVWTEVITSQVGCINLPVDHPRPRIQSFSGSELREVLAPDLAELARNFAKARNVSPFVVLLSVYYVLLHRYSRQELILVGVPFANRTEPELEDVVGLFINTLPLPMAMSEELTFSELMDATRRLAIRVQGVQDVPLGLVVEQLDVAREPSYNPLFQVGFTVQDPPVVMQIEGLSVEDLELHSGGSMYDLHTWLWDNPDGSMGFQIWYDDALFDQASVSRLMGHYRALLAECVGAPDAAVATYNCLAEAEQGELVGWNATAQEVTEPVTIPAALFSRDRDWDSAAVRCDGETLSHAELRDLSAQIANHLQGLGVGSGDLVGVLMERRLDLLPTLLGIMRLGAGYVPLDPEYPVERLEFIAADAGVKTICVHADKRGVLDLPEITFVEIDTQWDAIRAGSAQANFAENEDPESIAYVIHTSGSTGRPKGVLIPHRAASNFLRSMARQPGLTGDDVLLAVTTLSFDISVLELYLPLLVGGTVVVGTRDEVTDGAALVAVLENEGITTMQATPSTWRMMLAVGWDGPSDLRILCGGEAFPRDLAERLIEITPEVWNMYGPTETTVWSTCKRLEAGFEKILIGAPIDNTVCHIRTPGGAECPVGVPGELFIGGDGVAHGYLDRPELTAEKFVRQGDGEVLYATGDLAAWQAGGEIEHLGRIDSLVKVRGFRIELGEIEAAINDVSEGLEAVTTVWSPAPGDDRIVAYLRMESGTPPATGTIRKALRRRLPNYMIPQHMVPIDVIPMTANGKVDRRNLPAPDIAGQATKNVVAPKNATEEFLVELWARILGVPTVSVEDNFFNAGGQSLLAVQMIGEIEKKFGIRLKARTVILETLGGIAAVVADGTDVEDAEDEAPAPAREPKKGLLSRLFNR